MRSKMLYLLLIGVVVCAPNVLPRLHATSRSLSVQQADIPSDAEQAKFTEGQNLYNQRHYDQAARVLNDFLKSYPNSIIKDLTLLWLGRSYIQLGQFDAAQEVGARLHAIKDTPFVDIYDGELNAALHDSALRASAGGPKSTAAGGNRPAANSQNQVASVPRNSVPSPVASPSPKSARRVATLVIPSPGAGSSTNASSAATTPRANVVSNAANVAATNSGGNESARQKAAEAARNRQLQRQQARNAAAANNKTHARTVKNPPASSGSAEVALHPGTAPLRAQSPMLASQGAANISEASGLNITIKQVPSLALALRNSALTASPGQLVRLPLSVTNSGNKDDQFRLETDLPAEYQPTFSLGQSGNDTGLPILVTPQLARGATLDAFLNLRVPENAGDGQQRRFYVRAASQSDYQVMRISDASLTVAAAALTGAATVGQDSVLPGETFKQTILVRNTGTAAARGARADFVFNPDFELANANPPALVYDAASRTGIWNLGDVEAHDSREITLTLRAVPDALASSESIGRGMMRATTLTEPANFDGPKISVGRVTRVQIDSVSSGLTAVPGDILYIPFIVRNPGNYAESYELRITAPGAPGATVFADTNGDGLHQDNEPAITQTSQVDPRGGQYPMLLRVNIPRTTPDREQYTYHLVVRSVSDNRVAGEAKTVVTVAGPHVHIRTEQVSGAAAPGDSIFYRLVLVNDGAGLAKNLVITEQLPEALQFVDSDPPLKTQDISGGNQKITWHVPELAPNDTAVLRIAVRFRPGLQAETTLTSRHTLVYQDGNGNSYQGQ